MKDIKETLMTYHGKGYKDIAKINLEALEINTEKTHVSL